MPEPATAAPGGLVTFGESMGLVTICDVGPIEFGRDARYGIGGAESNVAIGAARLGSPVTWIGRLGQDATGELIERRLRAEGVRPVVIRDDAFTGIMVRHQRVAGHLRVDYHRAGSAASRLCPADIPDELLRAARILHVTGITAALSDSAREAVFDSVRRARALGLVVSFDVNYRSKLWPPDTAAPVLTGLAARADIVMAGEAEARLLLGGSAPVTSRDLLREIAGLGPAEVIVKAGARGCAALIDGVFHELPAISVPVVDPVGAGDAFAAGYLAEHLAGAPAPARVATAIAAGAYAVAVPGDCEGLPRRHELPAIQSAQEDADR